MTFELPPAIRSALTSSPCSANRPASLATWSGSSAAASEVQAARTFGRLAAGALVGAGALAAGGLLAGAGPLPAGVAGAGAQAPTNSAASSGKARPGFGQRIITSSVVSASGSEGGTGWTRGAPTGRHLDEPRGGSPQR